MIINFIHFIKFNLIFSVELIVFFSKFNLFDLNNLFNLYLYWYLYKKKIIMKDL
jgi:hypothetical protein